MCLHCTCTKQKRCYDVTFSSREGCSTRHLANGGNLIGSPEETSFSAVWWGQPVLTKKQIVKGFIALEVDNKIGYIFGVTD